MPYTVKTLNVLWQEKPGPLRSHATYYRYVLYYYYYNTIIHSTHQHRGLGVRSLPATTRMHIRRHRQPLGHCIGGPVVKSCRRWLM